MNITIIAAIARNGAIGKDGGIPWHYREDFEHFKRETLGGIVAMGLKTWRSLPKRPLPNRRNIVVSATVTREEAFGADIAGSLEQLAEVVYQDDSGADLFIIGGARLYAEALPLANRLILTEVDLSPEGDTFWQPDRAGFVEVERRKGESLSPGADTFSTFTEDHERSQDNPLRLLQR